MPRPYRSFRGFIAPASLKQVVELVKRDTVAQFPGLYRPGLIEASWDFDATNAEWKRFRGFIAPASLKREQRGSPDLLPVRFRGFIAPASLKPGNGRLVANRSGVSGALSPRPH